MEGWRPIPGFPCYEASSEGRVRRAGPPRPGIRVGLVHKQSLDTNGYPLVSIIDADGRPRTMNVHRIIALTFLGPRPDGLHISHLDGNRRNCSVDNLIYETPKQNHARKRLHGTQVFGDAHWTRRRMKERQCDAHGSNQAHRTDAA